MMQQERFEEPSENAELGTPTNGATSGNTPKKEMTWKELQSCHAASILKKGKQQGKRPTGDSTILRVTSRTNLRAITGINVGTPLATTPKPLSTPSPGGRREYLAKKGHLLGNRGSAYVFSPSGGTPNNATVERKPSKYALSPSGEPLTNPTVERKPSKLMEMILPGESQTPELSSAAMMKPTTLVDNHFHEGNQKSEEPLVATTELTTSKKDFIPISTVISNTSLSKIKLVRSNIKLKNIEALEQKTVEEAEQKKLELAASVARKYSWETKPKQDAPKPNKTASKAMSFRNAKLRENSRGIAMLVGMISPDAPNIKGETLKVESEETTTSVPAFRKNPFGSPGTELLSALKKPLVKAVVQQTPPEAIEPVPPAPLSSPQITTPIERRWSSPNQVKNPSRITRTFETPLAIERELEQRASSSAASDNTNTRRNLDKKTARLQHADDFKASIASSRIQHASSRPNHYLNENLHLRGGFGKNGVSIFVRKRPIFDYELDRGDFDVLFPEAKEDHDIVVVHVCQMHADMHQQQIQSVSFPCSAAFDEECSNEELYHLVARPLVNRAAQGGDATILMYGQTGSGKSFTMTGIEERVCNDLFQSIPARAEVSVQFIELKGKLCSDLLEEGQVKVVDQVDGSIRLVNAATVYVSNPAELSQLIARGKQRRTTEATDRNGVSSRSHAVCQISIHINSLVGMLTLLDLAGSERKNDSLYHSRERQLESSEINASLWALKECIRARASGSGTAAVHIPYRSSNLTRILRIPLESENSQLCVIATVAPNATDTEHTLETLKTLAGFVGADGSTESKHAIVVPSKAPVKGLCAPKQWDRKQVADFLKKKKCIDEDFVFPCRVDGRTIMRMNTVQIKTTFFEGKRDADERAVKLFRCIRAESDRVSKLEFKDRTSGSKGLSPF